MNEESSYCGRDEFDGYESKEDQDIASIFESLGDSHEGVVQEKIEQLKRRNLFARRLRNRFMSHARVKYDEYVEASKRDGKPILGIIKWLIAHPQIVLTIISIVMMVI